MVVNEKQLKESIKSGNYYPVYLLTGDENYYIDEVSNFIESSVVDESLRDFDQVILYGRDTNMRAVLSNAKQFPVMSPVRLVMVKEAQNIDSDEWDPLVEYLNHPQPQTLLVFCYRHKKLDKRKKVYKTILNKGCVFESAKMYDDRLPDWIGTYVNNHGTSITQKGAMLIAEYIGNDLGKIANELSKVFITLRPGEPIDENIIERNIGISKDYNVFELQKAIGRRDVVKCNRIVNHFAANPKDNPIQMVVSMLYSFFIKVMIYHQLPDKTKAVGVLNVNSFFIRDYATAASNYPLPKLASCIGYLYEADLRSKGMYNSGNVTDGELLKELIFKIIH